MAIEGPGAGATEVRFQGDSEGPRLAYDDLPSLGYPAGLAPAIPVVVPASCGSTCGCLSIGALR